MNIDNVFGNTIKTMMYILVHPIALVMTIIGIMILYFIATSTMSGFWQLILFFGIMIIFYMGYVHFFSEHDEKIYNCIESTMLKH